MPPIHWQRQNFTALLLSPISWLYGCALSLRAWCYRRQLYKTVNLPVPVIVVGNVLAGGVGKTPVVMAIVKRLQDLGYFPGVVSRGYGRKSKACLQVNAESLPHAVGDEPLLIFKICSVPVVVASDRVTAATRLLTNNTQCNVIVCDDGLQHRSLGRDIEIVVFDERGIGNGRLLPSGPLRENWPNLQYPKVATQFVLTSVQRSLENQAVNGLGLSINLLDLALKNKRPVHALAGIAKPSQFFQMLREKGISLVSCTDYPDHDSLRHLKTRYRANDIVLCTEKDAVKIWRYAPYIYAVPMQICLDSMFLKAFDASIKNLLNPQLKNINPSSPTDQVLIADNTYTNLDHGQQISRTPRMPPDQRPLAF